MARRKAAAVKRPKSASVEKAIVEAPPAAEADEVEAEDEEDEEFIPEPVEVKEEAVENSNRKKGADYSSTELLLLSRAYIAVSEDSIVGAAQRRNTFWHEVGNRYELFRQQHEAYHNNQAKIDAYNKAKTVLEVESVLGRKAWRLLDAILKSSVSITIS